MGGFDDAVHIDWKLLSRAFRTHLEVRLKDRLAHWVKTDREVPVLDRGGSPGFMLTSNTSRVILVWDVHTR
jgi:hypothetical protein